MRRSTLVILTAAIVLLPIAARAQEQVGAGRVEVGTALFGGGMVFLPQPAGANDSWSRAYAASGAVTFNFSRHFGIEGDLGLALGRHEALAVSGTALTDEKTPNVLMYSGSLVFNPIGRNHHLIPYVDAGTGAWSVFDGLDTGSPLAPQTTYFAVNAGGGARWFPVPHWGARADYQYVALRQPATAAASSSYFNAHRIYAGLLVTF